MSHEKQRPDFEAFTTIKRSNGQKDVWVDIGAGFFHADHAGISVVLNATPLDGRIILRSIQEPAAQRG